MIDYKLFITTEFGKRSGKSAIRGLGITVMDVLECLAEGMTIEEIVEEYPQLTPEDVRACIAVATDRER